MIRSADYRRWIGEVSLGVRILAKGGQLPDGAWRASCTFDGLSHQRDLDNCIKPLVDALVKSGVVPDDRWLHEINAKRGDPKATPSMRIEVAAVED